MEDQTVPECTYSIIKEYASSHEFDRIQNLPHRQDSRREEPHRAGDLKRRADVPPAAGHQSDRRSSRQRDGRHRDRASARRLHLVARLHRRRHRAAAEGLQHPLPAGPQPRRNHPGAAGKLFVQSRIEAHVLKLSIRTFYFLLTNNGSEDLDI